MRSLLNLLREKGNGVFLESAKRASSIRLGVRTGSNQGYDEFKEHLDELAQYCPNVVEFTCAHVNAKFLDFRELLPSQAETKLIVSLASQRISSGLTG
jgi:hypothetical protein